MRTDPEKGPKAITLVGTGAPRPDLSGECELDKVGMEESGIAAVLFEKARAPGAPTTVGQALGDPRMAWRVPFPAFWR
ncbi:hypothetical protein GCM10025762_45160 [Haloechinothrix salitolerans]